MKSAAFDYVRAGSVEETVAVLDEAGDEGKILAGGQSLVPLLALRLARPAVLVDVNRIPGLDAMHAQDGTLRVGALVRHRALAAQTAHPLLAAAAGEIGHVAIRTRGTFAGSVAHADPAAELPVVCLACDAAFDIARPGGMTRSVAADGFFDGPLMTCLADAEMVTGARLRIPQRWGFAEFARRHGDFALATVAVAVLDGRPRIALGGVAGAPVRATAAEDLLAGEPSPPPSLLEQAADAATADLAPTGDLHGSTEYRRALARQQVLAALRDTYHREERA